MTNRPLRSGELLEVIIEKTLTNWYGALQLGVTLHRPETIDYPTLLTEITDKIWCLSGSKFLKNGSLYVLDYGRNLDTLGVSI
jgi:neuralized-like protein 4